MTAFTVHVFVWMKRRMNLFRGTFAVNLLNLLTLGKHLQHCLTNSESWEKYLWCKKEETCTNLSLSFSLTLFSLCLCVGQADKTQPLMRNQMVSGERILYVDQFKNVLKCTTFLWYSYLQYLPHVSMKEINLPALIHFQFILKSIHPSTRFNWDSSDN